jgi:hypothetical protein
MDDLRIAFGCVVLLTAAIMGLFFPHKLQAYALKAQYDPFRSLTASKFYLFMWRIGGAISLIFFFYTVWMAIHGRIIVEYYNNYSK